MMNILGNKNLLAIQWDCKVLEEIWFPTQLCFWIGGQKIGNYEDTLQLYCYITRLENFLLYENLRYHPFLFNRSKEDIFNHVCQRAYCFIVNTEKDKHDIEFMDIQPFDQYFLEEEYQRWLSHVFTIGDMFFPSLRGYDIMLINEPLNNIQRLIWLDKTQSIFTLHEYALSIGYFERIAWEFLQKSIDFLNANGYDISYFDEEREQDWYGKFRKK